MNDVEACRKPIAILIPCYNCGKAVQPIIQECQHYSQRILLVNDGSTDETETILASLPVETIGWKTNQGKGTALREGFITLLQQEGWEAVITLDSDGQHDPSDIPALQQKGDKTHADLIIGRRDFKHAVMPSHRRWANRISSALIAAVSGCRIRDFQSGFRLIRRSTLERLLPHLSSTGFALETECILLAYKLGLKIEEVEIRCIYTPESTARSSWKPLLDSWRIVKVLVRSLFFRE